MAIDDCITEVLFLKKKINTYEFNEWMCPTRYELICVLLLFAYSIKITWLTDIVTVKDLRI